MEGGNDMLACIRNNWSNRVRVIEFLNYEEMQDWLEEYHTLLWYRYI